VEDINLRLEFHRALDAVAPPAPWLSAHVQEGLRQRRREGWIDRARRRPPIRIQWVLPLVAALLAVAIVATLLLVGHAFQPRPLPVKPPTHQAPAAAGCPAWGYIPGGGSAPVSITMMSATTGWAGGDLRTTDGGLHWHDVSPSLLRNGAPNLPGQQSVYPPGYADFFLDSEHAWIARSYSSSTACVDHINTFSTADGGRTWEESAPVALGLQQELPSPAPGWSQASPQPVLDFVDPQHGWLILTGSVLGRSGSVYITTNGGHDWRFVSNNAACNRVTFTSRSTGWSTCTTPNSFTGHVELWVTRDGGVSWLSQLLPDPPGGCPCSTDLPVFFDHDRGVVDTFGYTQQALLVTSDGGNTWRLLPPLPPGQVFGFDFVDANNFWALVNPLTGGKSALNSLYRSTDGGKTWNLVQRDTPSGWGYVTLQFVDANHGFVGQAPAFLVTADGGHTWTVIHPQIT
jgi:photosystem II stability/assembly factor-like uncharacterized protein